METNKPKDVWYQKNREHANALARARYKKHPKRRYALNDRWRLKNQERVKGYSRSSTLKKYGLTVEQYNTLLIKQHSVCAICGMKQDKNLAIDHNHNTSVVRGLLCSECNIGLGMFKDDPALLSVAIIYLSSR